MKLTDFKVLSFDCYGTLIDWETGIWNALEPLRRDATHITRENALASFAEIEPAVEHEHPKFFYRDILKETHRRLTEQWNLPPKAERDQEFALSVGEWPAFPDTVEALAYLKQHFKLVILSNVDRQSFARTNVKLRITFDAICTAEDIGSYKPDHRNFEYLLRTISGLNHSKSELLHCAQSLYHDIKPASEIGIARCWINRRQDEGSSGGATKALSQQPRYDFSFFSLAALAQAHKSKA